MVKQVLQDIIFVLALYDIWRIEIDNHRQEENFKVLSPGAKTTIGEPWLYAENTDYFIELSCPIYDDNKLYAVRTVNDGWFTLDIQSSWQGGTLDVDGSIYNSIIELIRIVNIQINIQNLIKYIQLKN